MPDFDLVVVGAGVGGYPSAIHAARLGAKVAIVEQGAWGGTCLNLGCIPTKALIHGVEVLKTVREAEQYGVRVPDGVELDWGALQQRKTKIVSGLTGGVQTLLKANGIEMVQGRGRLVEAGRVQVDGRDLTARAVVLAPGSAPARPPFPGAELGLTSDDVLAIDHVPASLVVIGGGVVGMEFASLFNLLGTEVTVIEMLDQLVTPVEPQIASRFQQLLQRRGIKFHLSTTVESLEGSPGAFKVKFGGGEAEAEAVLVATGRRPTTADMGLEEAGIALQRGAIQVDQHLRTSLEGVYAVGDATMISMLAHTASYQGELAAINALGEKRITADYTAIPSCIYTDPEIAFVGLSETQAKADGLDARTGAFPFTALGRAQILGETTGQVKLVTDRDGYLLGATIMGPRATDLIAEVTLALNQGLTAAEIAHTVHAHPTLPEAVMEAALDVDGTAVHIAPRKR
ncbi:MAG TPA: dihydrolipoyl dehydrogenase [Candidatus Dormibacteraeota bacterium]